VIRLVIASVTDANRSAQPFLVDRSQSFDHARAQVRDIELVFGYMLTVVT
jgi:hypothetical protein